MIKRADNRPYAYFPCFNVIYFSADPDDNITRRMLERFEYCDFDREYQSDGIYHYSFTLYWNGTYPGSPDEATPITDPEIHDLFNN